MPPKRHGQSQDSGQGESQQTGEQSQRSQSTLGGQPEKWIANTAVRMGLTIIGVILLVFALGQAVGLPLLELTIDALSSRTGRWLTVAFFALLLIGAAQRSFLTG